MSNQIPEPFDKIYIGGCYKCGEPMWMTRGTQETYYRSKQSFYCPHGHPQCYTEGETEETKLRRERDQLKQRIAYKDDCIRQAEARAEHERRRANGYKGHATKITKRAKAGVCPCCNRSFENLRRHMTTKHPPFTPLEIDQVAENATVQ